MGSKHQTMFEVACRRAARHGEGRSERRTHCIKIDGPYTPLWTFVGVLRRVEGVLTCYYHGSAIFAIDFINARITNFDMRGYSISTGQNVSSWESVCDWNFPGFERRWRPYRGWMHAGGYVCWSHRRLEVVDSMYERFCAKMSWLYTDPRTRVRWFCWEKYNKAEADLFHSSAGFLYEDQNWRYFDFDWGASGEWVRSFKSPDAERRWKARERKRELAARKRAA